MRSWALGLTAAAVMLAACTDGGGADPAPSPSPSPTATEAPAPDEVETGLSAVVVLPTRQARSAEEIERERAAVEEIGRRAIADGTIATLRTVVPDRVVAVGDVVELLAEEGHDLVCVLGPGAGRAVREVAPRFPGTRFCGAPAQFAGVPENALVFDLRIEEAAYLAGIAAAEAADFIPASRGTMPAIIVSDSSAASRIQVAFDQGYSISREPEEPTRVRVASSSAVAFETASGLYEAGVNVILSLTGRLDEAIIDAAREVDRLVIASSAVPVGASSEAPEDEEIDDSWGLMFLGENLSAAFRDAVAELATGWTGGQRRLGFRNGALTMSPGTSPIWPQIAPQVLPVRDELVAGTELGIGTPEQ